MTREVEMFEMTWTQENPMSFRHFNHVAIEHQGEETLVYDDELEVPLSPWTETSSF